MAKARWPKLGGQVKATGLLKNAGAVESGDEAESRDLGSVGLPHGPCWWARDAGVWFVFAAARGQAPPANTLLSVRPKGRPRLPEMLPTACVVKRAE